MIDRRKNKKPKFQSHDVVRTTDSQWIFLKADFTKLSYILYKYTKIFEDTIPSHHNDTLPEWHNEALLKKTQLSMKKKYSVMQKAETEYYQLK